MPSPSPSVSPSPAFSPSPPISPIPSSPPVNIVDTFGVNNQVNDSGVVTGLYVNCVLFALICIGISLVQRFFNAHHRLRLTKQSVVIRPPSLPETGHRAYWYWIWATLSTSNVDLLKSSGLDALMLVKTMAFGIQLFLPMAFCGIAILLPIHQAGGYLVHHDTGEKSELLTLTISNINPRSSVMWVHCLLVYVYVLYAMLLLRYHYYNYVKLRELYIKEGEDINYWQEVHMTAEEPKVHMGYLTRMLSTVASRRIPPSSAPTSPPSPQVTTRYTPPNQPPTLHPLPSTDPIPGGSPALSPTLARTSLGSLSGSPSRQAAARDLLHAPYFGEQELQSSTVLLSRADQPPPRPTHTRNASWTHAKTAKAFDHLTPGSRLDTHQDEGSHAPDCAPPAGSPVGSPGGPLDDQYSGLSSSGTARPTFNRWWESKPPQLPPADPSSAGSPHPPTHSHPATSGRDGSPTHRRCALSNIPSVRYRKTVNTKNAEGREVSVNAQQYVVLVTNVGQNPMQGRWTKYVPTWVSRLLLVNTPSSLPVNERSGPSLDPLLPPSPPLHHSVEHPHPPGLHLPSRPAPPSKKPSTGIPGPVGAGPPPPNGDLQLAALDRDSNSALRRAAAARAASASAAAAAAAAAGAAAGADAAAAAAAPSPAASGGGPMASNGPAAGPVAGPVAEGIEWRRAAHVGEAANGEQGLGWGRAAQAPPAVWSGAVEPSPFEPAAPHNGVRAAAIRGSGGLSFHVERDGEVASTFRELFPNDFDRAVPVLDHQEVDMLLLQWDYHAGRLDRAEALKERDGREPTERTGCDCCTCCACCACGPKVASIPYHTAKVEELEGRVEVARAKAFRRGEKDPASTPSWFVFFKSQVAASVAAAVPLRFRNSTFRFRVHAAPGPEEVNWQALWFLDKARELRLVLVLPFIIILLSLPVGVFTGALTALNAVFCPTKQSHWRWSWYCDQSSGFARFLQHLLTGWVPSVLLNLWQNMVLPRLLYLLAQSEGRWYSLSGLDRRIGQMFFWFNVFNVFLGGLLGAAVVSQVQAAVTSPGSIPTLLGLALPTASNFFISYVALRAMVLVPLRFLLPHPGVYCYLIRKLVCCGACRDQACMCQPLSVREKAEAMTARSVRHGLELGLMMIVFLIGLGYSVVAPMVLLPVCLYFCFAYFFWRYQVLYVMVRKYESGGLMWPFVLHRVLVCLFIFQFFTSCVLVVKGGFVQASLLWVTVPPILLKFHHYCKSNFELGVEYTPLQLAHDAPRARVNSLLYVAPPLQPSILGWYPEWMKAWEGWGAPTYGY